MNGFTESNITLNFPDENFFRFAGCAGYAVLSGNHFKEMDACWFDAKRNLYWLIELKDFTSATLATPETIEQKSWDIVKKAVDSLCMFLSSKHGYSHWENFGRCFPVDPNDATQFKLVTIVKCSPGQKTDVPLINNKFRSKFKPYADLFGIQYYAVIEHSAAIRNIRDYTIR
jgi:hypothetical protein